ncbi:MAG: 4-hydroxy-tetrahydrodipicolinate reductase [Opitutia bacterium]
MSPTLRILLHGAKGRMGQAIAAAAPAAGVAVVGVDQGDDPAPLVPQVDVVVDFSFHSATAGIAALAARHGKPLVIGTTGHTEAEKAAIRKATAGIPVVWAGNYSIGVNLLNSLVRRAARVLGDGWDVELVEMHHRLKKDAPSGTAEKLLEILRDERKVGADQLRHGRSGLVGERTPSEIGVHALRGGDVIGDHTVLFASDGERLELTHKASSRTIFAQGALRAARWVVGKPAGLHGMEAVLGLE